ncbi:MAG: hypothetical protein PHG85_06490 [Candidatus Altiarchaeota archaeon]|nr:hypothetical protein [Candidatus Altiarchaeota archaeon]
MILSIHVHSCFTDGVPTPDEIMEHCQRIGIDEVAITDQDRNKGSLIERIWSGDDKPVNTC